MIPLKLMDLLILGLLAACEPRYPDLDTIIADFERRTGETFVDCGEETQQRCGNLAGECPALDAIISCFVQDSCSPRRASISILDGQAGLSSRWHFAFPDQFGKCEYHTFATPYGTDQEYVVHERCAIFRTDDICERIHGIDCVEVDREQYSNELRE